MKREKQSRESRRNFSLIVATLLALAGLTACGFGKAEIPGNVTRPTAPYTPMHDANPSWINDHEILFLGHDGPDRNSRPYGIFIWNMRSQEVELYRSGVRNLCYFDGAISYLVVRDDKGEWLPEGESKYYFGKFGEEKAVPLPDGYRLSRFTCSPVRAGEEIDGWRVTPLLPGDGYYQGPNLDHPRGIYNASHERVAELPPKSHLGFQYLPWKESYFFSESIYGEDEGQTTIFLDYEPGDGAVKRIVSVPVIGWTQGFLRMRSGVLMRVNDSSNPEVKGVYSFDEGSGAFEQLRKGYVDLSEHPLRGVSPDGCKVAYTYEIRSPLGVYGDTERYLEVMDVCNEVY